MRSYSHYVEVVTAQGVTPISEELFNEWQTKLPAQNEAVQPWDGLNYAVAIAMEAGDNDGAATMIKKGDEYLQECWDCYLTDMLPAEGLHIDKDQWLKGREVASPTNAAHVVEFNGDLPSDIIRFELDNDKYLVNADSVSQWDEELGWDFLFYHEFPELPTIEQITPLIKMNKGEGV